MRKILVANRGEIARRVLRTVRAMGIASVAVYSDADRESPHVSEADEAVHIGPAPSQESYLAIERILEAARSVGADAVHPGYGFLAENPEFAESCQRAGLTFIGPSAEVIRKMGSKVEAKAIMAAAGVPVVPDLSGAVLEGTQLTKAAEALGFPLLVKASAGGGGRGMRIVQQVSELPDALASARRTAAAAFGDDTLLVERYIEAPRHIEIQILGDAHGQVIHCFERECSIQRRYQKVIEEAPSLAVDPGLRERLGAAAIAAGKTLGYVGAGTLEFLLAPSGEFFFMEMNTRLQVEHPVTEAITGLDLVRVQILLAQGEPLPIAQQDLEIDGHAIEARLYAEDPVSLLPASGRVALFEPAELPGLRYDSGVVTGSEVGVHYDPLLAKIIAHGPTRQAALERLVRALQELAVSGVTTNRDLLLAVLRHPAFEAGETDTHFLERHLPPEARKRAPEPATERSHAIAATLHDHERRRRARTGPLPPSIPSGWRNNPSQPQQMSYRSGNELIEVGYFARAADRFEVVVGGQRSEVRLARSDEGQIELEIDGTRRSYRVARWDDRVGVQSSLGSSELERVPRFPRAEHDAAEGSCSAPMPGVIREIRIKLGEHVEDGQILLVMEAMKMEHEVRAQHAGVVKELRVEVGQRVDPDTVLLVVEATE